jgi:hypothetical protein
LERTPALIGDFTDLKGDLADFIGDLAGDFTADFTADFKVERITERIIDFNVEAPFLEVNTLSTTSFSFFSFIRSNDVMLNAMSFFFAMVVFFNWFVN